LFIFLNRKQKNWSRVSQARAERVLAYDAHADVAKGDGLMVALSHQQAGDDHDK
jgi:hypothetical protein